MFGSAAKFPKLLLRGLRSTQHLITKVRVKFVLFFDASEDTMQVPQLGYRVIQMISCSEFMQARIIERGKTSGRSDDNLECRTESIATT